MRTILLSLAILFLPSIAWGQAVWRGTTYNHPVCNNPSCRMCNSIRSQLATKPAPQVCTGPNCPRVNTQPATKAPLTHITELVPTPEEAVRVAVELLDLNSDSILVEPGCGDGRLLAKTSLVCPSFGVELNQETATKARTNAPDAIVMTGDALTYHYESATHIYMYLYPELMDKIIQKLKKGTKIVSYMHTSPSLQWKEYAVASHKFYTSVK